MSNPTAMPEIAGRIHRAFAAIDDESTWPSDDQYSSALLLRNAIVAYGIGRDEQVIPQLGRYYEHCVRVLPGETRLAIYKSIEEALMVGYLSADALFPFILREPLAAIASSATLDHAQMHPVEPDDPLGGVRVIEKWIRRGNLANKAAVFAGLLDLGDLRLDALLDDLRACLSYADIAELARIDTGFTTISALEFWLRWLESALAAGLGSTSFFCTLASGLANLPRISQRAIAFSSVERNFGYRPHKGEQALRVVETLSVKDVATRYRARFYALEAAAPKVMSDVLNAYGLASMASIPPRGILH